MPPSQSIRREKIASLALFANNRAGGDARQQQVFQPARTQERILFAREATGHYWLPLYYELVRRGYSGAVLNPIQTNGEARTRIRKTKTDKRDAEGIARFMLTGKARAARIPVTFHSRSMKEISFFYLEFINNTSIFLIVNPFCRDEHEKTGNDGRRRDSRRIVNDVTPHGPAGGRRGFPSVPAENRK